MAGCEGMSRRDCERAVQHIPYLLSRGTHHQLAQPTGLFPAAFPNALHPLDGDEPLADPFCARPRPALHS